MPDNFLAEGMFQFATYLHHHKGPCDYRYDVAYESYKQLLEKLVVTQVTSDETAIAQIIAAASMLERMTEDETTSKQEIEKLAEKVMAALYSLLSFIETRLPPSEVRESAVEYGMPARMAPMIGDAFIQQRLEYLIPWVNGEYADTEPGDKPAQFLAAAE